MKLDLDELMDVLVQLGDYTPDTKPKFSDRDLALLQPRLDEFAAAITKSGKKQAGLFGYFSILYSNADLTGHKSQDEVPASQIQPASITGYEITPVISTNYYGNAGLTGVAVGLSPKDDAETKGVAVMIDVDDPSWGIKKAVARYIAREILAENFEPADGSLAQQMMPNKSHMMYDLVVGQAQLDNGQTVPTLFVRTNFSGSKNPALYAKHLGAENNPAVMNNFLAFQMAFGDGTDFWTASWGDSDWGDKPNGLKYFDDAIAKRKQLGYPIPENLLTIVEIAKTMRGMGSNRNMALHNFTNACLNGDISYPGAGAVPVFFGDSIAQAAKMRGSR